MAGIGGQIDFNSGDLSTVLAPIIAEVNWADGAVHTLPDAVNANSMTFYEIFNTYKIVAIVLATGYRVAHNGKTHQDILVAWLSGVSYMVMNELRLQLERVI